MAKAGGAGDRDKPDWMQVPVVSAGDFRHKYSPTLDLLGNVQHLAYAHPKLLGRCYDNIYYQGQLIETFRHEGNCPQKHIHRKSITRSMRR